MSDEPIKPQEQERNIPQTQAGAQTGAMPQQHAQMKKSTSGLAVAGLVLGIIALLSCWIPLFNIVTTPLAILGLVLAIIGVAATAPQKPKGGRGIAIAGTVLCAVSLVAFFAMYGSAAVVGGSAADDAANTEISASNDTSASNEDSQAAGNAAEDSGIVIKSCKASKDYSGNKTAVITLEWTNNSDDTTAFFTEYTYTAYVDGEEVDRSFADGDGWYEDQTKIKPGKSKTMKLMYEWDGKSKIDFEVGEWFGSEPLLSQTLTVK